MENFKEYRSRRQKVAYVSTQLVMRMLLPTRIANMIAYVEPSLPEGTQVMGVYNDYMRDCFAFILQNDSWDEVPEGQELPEYHITLQTAKVGILEE